MSESAGTRVDVAYAAIVCEGGFTLGIAQRDSPGYTPTNYDAVETYEAASAWADEANRRLGLTPAQAAEIVASSMGAQNRRDRDRN